MNTKIAVVDDEAAIRNTLKGVLEDEGYNVLTAEDGTTGLRLIRENIPDCVLLDIWMPGLDGIEVLNKLKEELPQIPVIIMSGHGTIETAVKATKTGAFDFIEKPISLEKLLLLINNAVNYYKILNENLYLKKQIEKDEEVIAYSPRMQKLLSQLSSLAKSNMSIILSGEEGTGKSFYARFIHNYSQRAMNSFIDFNATLSSDVKTFREKIILASEGTLYIKNFTHLSEEFQKLILQNKEKLRMIFSTSIIGEDVIKSVSKDFLFNLNATHISIPNLNERKEDIPYFIQFFTQKFSKIYTKKIRFSDEAMKVLTNYQWHGNIKELKNLVEHIFLTFSSEVVTHRDLPDYIVRNCKLSLISEQLFQHNLLSEAQKSFEKEFIKIKLIESCGNLKKTSEITGVEQSELQKKIKFYNLSNYVKQ